MQANTHEKRNFDRKEKLRQASQSSSSHQIEKNNKKKKESGGRKDNSSTSTDISTSVPDLENLKLIDDTNVVDKFAENAEEL